MHSALLEAQRGIIADLDNSVPSYTDFALRLVLPDGKRKGGFLEPTPAQQCIFQAADLGYRHIIIVKPVQAGATTAMLVPFFRRAMVEYQTCIVCFPTAMVGKDIWIQKASPILEGFGGRTILKGGGSKGGAAQTITLPGGGRFVQRSGGGRGESGQAAVSGDCMLIDEIDDYEDRHTILNLYKRIKESPDPLIVEGSTIKSDHNSKILQAYETGTKTHLEVPCPLCGTFQRLIWDNVDLTECKYRCCHCLELWDETQRREALEHWKRVDECPEAQAFSFKWSVLDDVLNTLHQEIKGTPMLPGYESAVRGVAMDDHTEMRSFYRDRLAEVYVDDEQPEEGEVKPMSPKFLADRSAHGWCNIIPDLDEGKIWSRYVAVDRPVDAEEGAIALDVQGDRIYWTLVLFNYKGVTWDFAWGTERMRMRLMSDGSLEPEPWAPGEMHLVLNRIRDLVPELTQLPVSIKIVDTQYEGAEIARWLAENKSWHGLRGTKSLTSKLPVLVKDLVAYEPKWTLGVGRYEIVTLAARARVHDAYRKNITEPGAAILPRGLKSNDAYIKHLCAWVMAPRKTNDLVVDWEKKQRRDDYLDCRTYAMALIIRAINQRSKPRSPVTYGVVGTVGNT